MNNSSTTILIVTMTICLVIVLLTFHKREMSAIGELRTAIARADSLNAYTRAQVDSLVWAHDYCWPKRITNQRIRK